VHDRVCCCTPATRSSGYPGQATTRSLNENLAARQRLRRPAAAAAYPHVRKAVLAERLTASYAVLFGSCIGASQALEEDIRRGSRGRRTASPGRKPRYTGK